MENFLFKEIFPGLGLFLVFENLKIGFKLILLLLQVFGISNSQNFREPSFLEQSVWAISNKNKEYKNSYQYHNKKIGDFETATIIDMKLDLEKMQLSFFNLDNGNEFIMKNIGKSEKKGYVPHFNLTFKGTLVAFKKFVDPSRYSTSDHELQFN